MAIRLEKSGGLLFIRGCPDPPEKKRRNWHVGLWLLLAGSVLAAVYAPELQSQWPAISHAIHGVLGAMR